MATSEIPDERAPESRAAAGNALLRLPRVVRRPLAFVLAHLPFPDAKLLAIVASPEVRAEPWAVYRRLRETHPVYRSRLGAWIVASATIALCTPPRNPISSALPAPIARTTSTKGAGSTGRGRVGTGAGHGTSTTGGLCMQR